MVLAVGGFAFGFALVTVGADRTAQSSAFLELAEFEVWRLLLAANFSVWFASIPIQRRWFKQVHQIAESGPRGFWWAFVAFVLTLALVAFVLWLAAGESRLPLDDGRVRLILVQLVGVAAASPAAMGLLIIGSAAFSSPVAWESSTSSNVHRVLDFRRYLRRFLAVLGGFIGLMVLATGALRNAQVAVGIEYRSEFVVLYGALFTALVAAYYVPAFSAVENLAKRILNRAFPIPTIGEFDYTSTEATAHLEEREVYSRVLQLGGTAKENLEGVLLVFTPLITALVTSALGNG